MPDEGRETVMLMMKWWCSSAGTDSRGTSLCLLIDEDRRV